MTDTQILLIVVMNVISILVGYNMCYSSKVIPLQLRLGMAIKLIERTIKELETRNKKEI